MSDYLRDQDTPMVLGHELDRETLTPKRTFINYSHTDDYGCDPIGDGIFRMVPSGDIVDADERYELQQQNTKLKAAVQALLHNESGAEDLAMQALK